MLYYAVALLIVAVLGAIFGFGLAASAFAALAKVFFYLALVGFLVLLALLGWQPVDHEAPAATTNVAVR